MPSETEAETVLMERAYEPVIEVMAEADSFKVPVGVKVLQVLEMEAGAAEAAAMIAKSAEYFIID